MRFLSRPDSYRDFPRPQDPYGSMTNEIPRRFALLGMTLVVLLVFYRLRNAFVIPNECEESPSQTLHAHSNQPRGTRRQAFRIFRFVFF